MPLLDVLNSMMAKELFCCLFSGLMSTKTVSEKAITVWTDWLDNMGAEINTAPLHGACRLFAVLPRPVCFGCEGGRVDVLPAPFQTFMGKPWKTNIDHNRVLLYTIKCVWDFNKSLCYIVRLCDSSVQKKKLSEWWPLYTSAGSQSNVHLFDRNHLKMAIWALWINWPSYSHVYKKKKSYFWQAEQAFSVVKSEGGKEGGERRRENIWTRKEIIVLRKYCQFCRLNETDSQPPTQKKEEKKTPVTTGTYRPELWLVTFKPASAIHSDIPPLWHWHLIVGVAPLPLFSNVPPLWKFLFGG